MIDRFAKRVVFNPHFLRDVPAAATQVQQALSLSADLGRHHRRPPTSARSVEALDTFSAIFLRTAQDAHLRHTEGVNDLSLGTRALTTQLRGKHAKRWSIVVGMPKHRLDPAEVGPLLVFANDADELVNLGRTGRNQRQQGLGHAGTFFLNRIDGHRRGQSARPLTTNPAALLRKA